MVITRERARTVLENIVSAVCNSVAEKAVYISPDFLSDLSIVLDNGKKVYSPYSVYFLGFVDEAPKANWAHNCKYVFINANDGSCQIINGSRPPDDEIYSLEKIL